ncbi:hypothetical protein T440DRAFT_514540 [Plenodomus tracheiphilus IPT5]|uniref:HMG box domain-containing protein n=1 Tax=Plenodomus tracheiphilus IPT5 TaxID=1408161 RepID=A0A6A7BKJ9_9PLEO|nr:hypothetical protein T440DRAFT_514540 [Plenodomus tracheiphilus IPT5]
MSDLKDRLARLGLSQYHQAFAAEGFDTWETVVDITESDLSHLSVKLGHRRKLQRAIAESRGQSSDRPLSTSAGRAPSPDRSYRSDDSGPEGKSRQGEASVASNSGTSTKRKYRRHPKPDEHAPERPPSAYVIFSNQVRESLKGQDLSFTEIAKVVGERWQVLPTEEREGCERQANGAKEKYYAELAEYKKTPQFEAYQKYLEDFKAKHAAPTKEGKRSKLETETSRSTRSSSRDHHERTRIRRASSIQHDMPLVGSQKSNVSPPLGPVRLPAGPSQPSKPTSPMVYSLSGYNSPRLHDHFSPVLASPRSANMQQRDAVFDITSTHSGRDLRGPADANMLHQAAAYNTEAHLQANTAAASPYLYNSHYQPSIDLVSRRTMRDSTRLPPLSHEDTTLSSESGHSGPTFPLAQLSGQTLPMDPSKTFRMLPQPVPSLGPSPSPLDRPAQAQVPHPQQQYQHQDYRSQGSLAVLLRAGELAARTADDDAMEEAST